jgi:hypothetical protein
MKKILFFLVALTLGIFAFVSCDRDDDSNDRGDIAGKVLTLKQQQQIFSNSLNGFVQKVDFSDLNEAIAPITSKIGMKFDLDKFMLSLAISGNRKLYEKVRVISNLFSGDTVCIDFESLYLLADIDVYETVAHNKEPVLAAKINSVSYDNDCFQLNVNMDGHKYVVKIKGNNICDATFEYRSYYEYKNKFICLPESLELTIQHNGNMIVELNLGLDSDFDILVVEPERGCPEILYTGSKCNFNGKIRISEFELDGSFSYIETGGLEYFLGCIMSGTDFIELSGRVDATFKNFSGAGCEDMVAWATDPEQLRGINFNMSFNDDEVKLLARIENPFKDRELGMEIKSILTSESEVGVSKNRIQKMVDKMNKLLRVEIYFKGYSDPQATIRLAYFDRALIDNNIKGFDLVKWLKKHISKSGAVPVVVVHDEEGNEVYASVHEYFGDIDIEEAVNVFIGRLMQEFGPYVELLSPFLSCDE